MLSENDLSFLQQIGISAESVSEQLTWFEKGFPHLKLIKPASVNDGIVRLSPIEIEKLVEESSMYHGSFSKFVPASGAATRMFKELMEYRTSKGCESTMEQFTKSLNRFPFFDDLKRILANQGYNIDTLVDHKQFVPIIDALLEPSGLNYGSLPKGLIKFHRYDNGERTAFEEQIAEGIQYVKSDNNSVNIHFTVSPDYEKLFKTTLSKVSQSINNKHNILLNISFSQQKKSTDTVAVTEDNKLFRKNDGNLLFRPGGHGALIENLDELEHDIIFIKNIDNVVPDRLKHPTTLYKKALLGYLLQCQKKIFSYIDIIQTQETPIDILSEILDFTLNQLFVVPPAHLNIEDNDVLRAYLLEKLDRPLRVCGMVKNEGEPGGGPFWALNNDGSVSLQIVESSQVNHNDDKQKSIFSRSTHFNPVDLVCAVNRYNGQRFNVLRYTDPTTGFISTKSYNGTPIRVQELPGLWNGAMSNWNTVFVEVPLETFNPVKTVMDLLRDQHQA